MSVELVNSHVLLPDLPNWRERPRWSRLWQTEISEAVTGAEARGALRQKPRVRLEWLVTPLSLQLQQAFEARLQQALKTGYAAAPYWGMGSVITSAAGGNAYIDIETGWPWATGDWLFVGDFTDLRNPVYVTKQITAVTSTRLSFAAALARTFTGFVWPLIFGRLEAKDVSQVTNHRGDHQLVLNELTGAFTAGSSTFTTYLGRPVFETQVNWADRVNRRLEFDLRELMIGFGAEVFAPLQSHVVHGFEVAVDLEDWSAILAHDDFTAALKGRLAGFWLPSPQAAFEIAAGEDATHFDIVDQGLTDTLADHPARYVRFTKAGQTAKHARVTAVTDNGDGTERVTVDASVTVNETWEAHWLHYVRLADDTESATLIGEQRQRRSLRLLELPMEYAAFETGESPVYLYHFWMDAPVSQDWYYTSFAATITSNGQAYAPKPVSHGELKFGGSGEAVSVNIEAAHESGHPLSLGLPYPSPMPVNVEIMETTFADPDTTTTLFTGQIERTPRKGKRISARAVSNIDLSGQRFMDGLIGTRCSYQVYEPATCKVSKAAFQKTGCAIVSITGRTIRVSHVSALSGLAAQWFTFGWIETGMGANFERRTVVQDTVVSGTQRDLVLNLPLVSAVAGQAITLVPGCDGKWATCQDKFSNDNFSGHPFVPEKNPTLIAIPVSTSRGGKK